MAPLPVVPGAIKIEFLWSQEGLPAANVLHASYSSDPPSSGDLQTFAAALGGLFSTDIRSLYTTDTELVAVQCTDLSSDSGGVGLASIGITGTVVGAPCTAQACILTSWKILRRYRGGHPRTYWPAPCIAQISTVNSWYAACTDAFTTFAGDLQAACLVVSYGALDVTDLGTVSYVDSGAPRVDPIFEPFVGASTDSLVRTQRRRLTSSSY